MVTAVWLSSAVLKVWLFLVGIVVFLGINGVRMPPSVSMPNVKGVTSKRRMSLTSPERTPAWTAAPMATHSIGSTPRSARRLSVSSTNLRTIGMRVGPPTRMILLTSSTESFASFSDCSNGFLQRCTIGSTICSSSARVNIMRRFFDPEIKGKLISVSIMVESSIFARSAASRTRCTAVLSSFRSIFVSCSNFLMMWFMTAKSMSVPPSCVSPEVDLTSKTPSPSSMMVTSKVPPPRSKTRIFDSLSCLSRPYANDAAVGSLMMRTTLRPAISPASLVAWRWLSSKYAGTVITAFVTGSPKNSSASCFIFCRINAEICCGV